jgi:salicylate hydroxylase
MQEPLIVVGGGIGGLATALALANKKIPSIVLEQAPEFREAGAGIILCPNAVKIFCHLGVGKEIIDCGFFLENLIYSDGLSDHHFINLPMREEIEKRFHYPYISVHREDLLKVLIDACRKTSLVNLVPSARIMEVKEENHRVVAFAEDKKTYAGPALIGCDGLWSHVRKYVSGDEPPRYCGTVNHRGVVHRDKLPKELIFNHLIHWDRPGGHIVLYPMGRKGYINIVAVYVTDDVERATQPTGDPETLYKVFDGSIKPVMDLLNFIDTSKKWGMFDREPTKIWSKGNVTLLGDAAHPTLPHLTQGAAMAIEDAAVLAKKIDENGSHYKKAFEEYQQARYVRTSHIQLFSRMYSQMHHAAGIPRDVKLHLLAQRTNEENYQWLKPVYQGIEI